MDQRQNQIHIALEKVISTVGDRFDSAFRTRKGAMQAGTFVRGLLGQAERKTSWQLSESLGLEQPYTMQHVIDGLQWSHQVMINELQRWVGETYGQCGAFIIDETGFLKKGSKSAGVARQYTGTAGKVENAQVGVFAAWATQKGSTLIDHALYLPRDWIEDKKRRSVARIPDEVTFKTKIALGMDLLKRAQANGLTPDWVLADAAYGGSYEFRQSLEQAGYKYILGVKTNQSVTTGFQKLPIAALFHQRDNLKWHRLSMGAGTKSDRKYDWACIVLNGGPGQGYIRIALARRCIQDPTQIAYFLGFLPKNMRFQEVVLAAGLRWRIEECFESAKSEVGLDHYEVRSWHGWYKHITLSVLALAILGVARISVDELVRQKAEPRQTRSNFFLPPTDPA